MQPKSIGLCFFACLAFFNSAFCQYGANSNSCAVTATSLGCANYRVLTIATPSNGNFLKVNPDVTFTGFVWDLVNILKETAGLQFTLSLETSGFYGKQDAYGNWIGMLGQLIANTTDIIISDLTVSASRLMAMDFSVPLMPYHVVTVTQPNASLNGIKYAVKDSQSDYNYLKASQDPQAQQIWASIQANQPISLVKDENAGVALVKQGGWAYVTGDVYVRDLVENSNGQLVINRPALLTNYIAMGVQPGSPVLRPLDTALLKLMANGQLQQLLAKWNLVTL